MKEKENYIEIVLPKKKVAKKKKKPRKPGKTHTEKLQEAFDRVWELDSPALVSKVKDPQTLYVFICELFKRFDDVEKAIGVVVKESDRCLRMGREMAKRAKALLDGVEDCK